MDEDRVDQDPATQTKVAFALHHRGSAGTVLGRHAWGLLALFMRIFAGGITLDSIDGCQSFSCRQGRAVRLVARLSFRSVWLSD
ncbi:hypothetical protein CX648_13035 [Aeromonas dhakensis]|nr:hypothetical protein CX648_13035 [Aeromonas dhakensis]